MKKQLEANGSTQKLGQIGRHSNHFRQRPHSPHNRPWKMLTTQFSKIMTSRNTQLGRQYLNKDSHQVTDHNDPEEEIAKTRSTLNIGREITSIYIGHTGNKR